MVIIKIIRSGDPVHEITKNNISSTGKTIKMLA
nr:hypothetical protein CJLB15_00075 [Campylobacter phage CJLB-15]